MMLAVQTLLSGDVHQLHNPGKREANATGRYLIPVFHAKEKNNHHFYTIPEQDTVDQFAGLNLEY